jgi:hypothetical protein
MSSAYTSNLGLKKPATATRAWDVILNANMDLIDAAWTVGGPLYVTTTQRPSTSLSVTVAPGYYIAADLAVETYIGGSTTLPASTTSNVYLDSTGTLSAATSWPSSNHVRLATVVTGTSIVTSVTDARIQAQSSGQPNTLTSSGGTLADATAIVTITTGSTNGTDFGGSTTDMLGFHGATPSVQRSGSAQANVSTIYTTALTDSTGGTASTTLSSISDTATKNAVSSLCAQLNNAKADITNLQALTNELRASMVGKGLIKGSA